MEIKEGTTINEPCKCCRAKIVGVVDRKGVANFACLCGHHWNYSVKSSNSPKKYTSDWLRNYLKEKGLH